MLKIFLILFVTSLNIQCFPVIIHYKSGKVGAVNILDTLNFADTNKSHIKLIGDDSIQVEIEKSQIEYVISNNDTLRFNKRPQKASVIYTSTEHACQSSETSKESFIEGQTASNSYTGIGWLMGGLGLGFASGPLGSVIHSYSASHSHIYPKTIPEDVDGNCYQMGFEEGARPKAKFKALAGGIFGSLFFFVIVVTMHASLTKSGIH